MEKMVPNLHINSVLPHHSCESTRSSKVRKTEHRPNNFMKNGPEKPINASSGTRWTSGKRAPREQWFLGKKHKAQPQGGQEHAVGKDLSPEVNGASHCFSWKQAVAAEILQGVRKKKTDSFRGVVIGGNPKVASGWCEAGTGASLSTESQEGAGILNHHSTFKNMGVCSSESDPKHRRCALWYDSESTCFRGRGEFIVLLCPISTSGSHSQRAWGPLKSE